MKYHLLLILILPVVAGLHPAGNPFYDFPERLAKKNGRGFGYLNANMTDLSISGYYFESRLYEDSFYGPTRPVKLTLNDQRIIDARDFILKEAAKYRIVLINEAHNRPEHRLFTKSLLAGLHVIGYNVLMAEGIKLKNGLNSRSYPTSDDGYLLNEPVYGSMLRYANKLGYTVNAYEYDDAKQGKNYWDDSIKLDKYGSIKFISYEPRDSMILIFDEKGLKNTILTSVRESSQAQNIVKVIRDHPSSKFIIHVGYGHLYEAGAMMGAKLRALLHSEDVLTIDQTLLSDRVAAIDTITGDTLRRNLPFVLQDTNTNRFFNVGIPVDYMVFGKTVHDSLMRPGYLFEDVEKRTVYYPAAYRLKDCPCLFSAYYKDEYNKEGSQTIATDVVYIIKQQKTAPLLLYNGKYVILKMNKDGALSKFNCTIK
jgi:hypothetical protein